MTHLIQWTRKGTLFGPLVVTLRETKVNLPTASPRIASALKVDVPFSLIGAIIGEFMAASRGLGYMIQLNTNPVSTSRVW